MNRPLVERRTKPHISAPRSACRVKGCDKEGVMRYCMSHTPPQGVGLAKCGYCGKPVADHDLTDLCR